MADISAEISAFQNAVYGEDVRTALVNLANKVNNESSAAASATVDGFVTTDKLADGAISTAKLADGSVTLSKLGNDIEITPPDGSITDAKLVQSGGVLDKIAYISEPSRNLWVFDNSVTFTRYKQYKPGGVIFPAGTYVFSASIAASGSSPTALVRFDGANNNEVIAQTTIRIGNGRKSSGAFTLSQDCYAVWLFSQTSSTQSTGVQATYTDIQIELGNTATSYVPPISARDTNLETDIANITNAIQTKVYGAGHLLPSAVGVESLGFIENGSNLFNFYDDKNISGYVDNRGRITANDDYRTSWYIKVQPSTVYYLGGLYSNSSYKNVKFLCEYDDSLNVVLWHSETADHFTTQSNTKYVRFTYRKGVPINYIYFGSSDWDGINAPEYTAIIPSKYIDVALTNQPNQYSVSGNLTDGGYLKNEDMANSICRNERIVFNSDVSSFAGLEIGFAWSSTNYKYNRFVIDGTNLTIYNYNGGTTVVAHGLAITNNIQVLIESDFMRTCAVTIISNGQLFKTTDKALDRRRVDFLYAQSVGSSLPNAKLSWTCADFDKPIWIFGDSYVASYTDKWVKYLFTYEYDKNVLFDAFPGESSSESLVSLQHLLEIAKPKKIVWCLGMNDGTDQNNTPSSVWLTAQNALRPLCMQRGIELILATIPSVPTINHTYKNANVRASGYRYIDFSKAVGASSSGVWFSDMLSQDGIHPSDTGAKALFGRALLDVPEIMVTP